MLEGKLTVKGHVRLTEELDREISFIADFEHRKKQDQTRVLIVMGIQSWREGNRDVKRRTVTQDAASDQMQRELPMTPIAARRLPVSQRGRA